MTEVDEIRPAVAEAAPAEAEARTPELPRARSMTRAEFKAFRAAGADPAFARKAGDGEADQFALLERNEAMVDWILKNIYPETDFDNVPNCDCFKLAQETYALTMGVPPEKLLKNS